MCRPLPETYGRPFLHSSCGSRATGDSQSDRSPPPRGLGRDRVLRSPEIGAAKSTAAGHSTRSMQQLCEVSVDTYLAAGNPFDVVSRPGKCERCKEGKCFQRHGTYLRYVETKHVKVARFLCAACGLTVSMLPMFVLPYRNRLVEAVDQYFRAEKDARMQMGDTDLLRRYWHQWVGHFESVQRDTGWPPQRPLGREPRAYWQQMATAASGMAAAQKHLIGCYGISLLRRYGCHVPPERLHC